MAFTESDFLVRFFQNLKKKVIGSPKDIEDPRIFHKISLIALMAWIGLGADGLSSSSYGPEEAFRTLGDHTYLALLLAIATALTVFIISYAYSRIIEHFPSGGGGYIVATHTLGERAGVISGCALLVDYILTITVSIVSCTDALFSFLPIHFQHFKLLCSALLILLLIILNLRGVKESITFMAPIFVVFILTHLFLIIYGIFSHLLDLAPIVSHVNTNITNDISKIGMWGLLAIFVRSYSMGAGTYTGIEAVSNGLQIMREPKVHTGKRTMALMAFSLSLTAGGLFICYVLFKIHPVAGRTLNAVLADEIFSRWPLFNWLGFVTIFSEGALLFVAAQTGFIDGPRVMSNMAIDSWLQHRFSAISERLTTHNGVLLMGISSLLLLFYTNGSISTLIVMYSINVFLTFSLSESGMIRFFIKNRKKEKEWKKHIIIQIVGLILCLGILMIAIYEKFLEGGWLTLVITSGLIIVCYRIRNHYQTVKNGVRKLDDILLDIPVNNPPITDAANPKDMTAVLLVNGYNGFGLHTFFSIFRSFPGLYKNFIFISIAVVDSGSFKGIKEIDSLKESTEEMLKKYVDLTRRLGFPAEYRYDVGTEVVEPAVKLCLEIVKDYPRSAFFSGKLIFRKESIFQRIFHNETGLSIQRHLQWQGIPTVILPIRTEV